MPSPGLLKFPGGAWSWLSREKTGPTCGMTSLIEQGCFFRSIGMSVGSPKRVDWVSSLAQRVEDANPQCYRGFFRLLRTTRQGRDMLNYTTLHDTLNPIGRARLGEGIIKRTYACIEFTWILEAKDQKPLGALSTSTTPCLINWLERRGTRSWL